jgi:leucine dehydrogenase
VINGGGIINVAAEISGTYSCQWVEETLPRLILMLGDVLEEAVKSNLPTNFAEDRIARARIATQRSC